MQVLGGGGVGTCKQPLQGWASFQEGPYILLLGFKFKGLGLEVGPQNHDRDGLPGPNSTMVVYTDPLKYQSLSVSFISIKVSYYFGDLARDLN